MIITPTVGRVVWYTPAEGSNGECKLGSQPFKADIVYVHDDRRVNLSVFDHQGGHFIATEVQLLQEDDEKPAGGRQYCEWMPYQTQQAHKHAAEDAQS